MWHLLWHCSGCCDQVGSTLFIYHQLKSVYCRHDALSRDHAYAGLVAPGHICCHVALTLRLLFTCLRHACLHIALLQALLLSGSVQAPLSARSTVEAWKAVHVA